MNEQGKYHLDVTDVIVRQMLADMVKRLMKTTGRRYCYDFNQWIQNCIQQPSECPLFAYWKGPEGRGGFFFASANAAKESDPLSLSEMVALLEKLRAPVIHVSLNNDYDAIISTDGVTVGCQRFPLEKIVELHEAYKKVKQSTQ